MIEMIKYWWTGCTACIGNAIYKKASAESEYRIVYCLLIIALTIGAGIWTFDHMYPFEGFSDFILMCVLILIEISVLGSMLDSAETKLLTDTMRKYEPASRLYAERSKEKAAARMAGMSVRKYRKAKKQAEQEKAERERADRERARRLRDEWERIRQREQAAQERAQREQAERERARKAEQNSSIRKARQLMRLREVYTMSDLKKARNTLIKEFHPDNRAGGNEEMCKKINAAYVLLSKYAKTA